MKAIAGSRPIAPIVRIVIVPLFLISGATGLIYEVTWMRLLGTVFGNTVFAASTVLTAFMLGLAAGSWAFGRLADRSRRPLRFYALLELGVGLYALAFPTILTVVDRFYLWFYQTYEPGFTTLNLVRFGVSCALLLLPTAFMGGTLPVLSSLWAALTVRDECGTHAGQGAGLLYAVNSFGAAAGSLVAGYFLIRWLGVSRSIYLAAAANVGVALLSLLLSVGLRSRRGVHDEARRRRLAEREVAAETEPTQPPAWLYSAGRRWAVLSAVLLAGFGALALEVLWTRVLVFVLETSAYAFACMLTCFILGIAVGSLLSSTLLVPRLKNPLFALGAVEFCLALAVAASIPLLAFLWQIDIVVLHRVSAAPMSFSAAMATHFIDALAVMLVPTVLMGAAFPIAVKACTPGWRVVGRRVGQVYACNTLGCVFGAFTAGFVMIPRLGVRYSFVVTIALFCIIGVGMIILSGRRRMAWALPVLVLSVVLVAALAFLMPADVFLRTVNTYHYPSEIVFIEDGVTGTVTVHDLPDGDRLIAVDGVDVAGVDLMLRTTQKLQAYAPLVIHEDPQDVLQIGYGSGETCGIGLDFGVPRYSIAEICPGVFEAGRFFEDINRGSYKDPNLRKIIMDGKNFVKLTDERFDVIMNDSTYPGTTGSSALYTYDHFKACRERLKPGGVLSCWMPLDLRPEDFQITLRSFQRAMPHCSLWMVNNCLNKHAVLIGTMDETRLDFARIKRVIQRPDVLADLKEINIHSVYDFLDCLLLGPAAMAQLAGDGPLNTDDRPYLEFGAAIKRDVEGCWLAVLRGISELHEPVLRYVANAGPQADPNLEPRAVLKQYYVATNHTLRGMVGILQGDPDVMNPHFEQARQANPYDRDVEYILDEMRREIEALTEAIEDKPAAAPLRSRLAKRYMLLRRYDDAAAQYERFIELLPGNAAVWNNLGACYKKLERWEKAVEAFERAIQWQPGLYSAYAQLAEIHETRGDIEEAVAILERLLPLLPRPRQAQTHDALARLHFLQKHYTLALAELDRAIELTADQPDLRRQFEARRRQVRQEARTARR